MEKSDKIFTINESLKDALVSNFNIVYAKTIYHKNGSMYLEDPFYETEASWPTYQSFKSLSTAEVYQLSDLLHDTKIQIEDAGGQMTQPIFEIYDNQPRMVWAIFLKR